MKFKFCCRIFSLLVYNGSVLVDLCLDRHTICEGILKCTQRGRTEELNCQTHRAVKMCPNTKCVNTYFVT